ncbi:outer membrane beta-barrel family protein [Pedobacter sp. MR22-3]|uniref:outer membrane beta-barrel family protein n=1 Tax=Pedobacter sp. MR22-3 TaxID=2994552 RepID=UPI0022466B0B|nr:outer membrane beta-barrel family protein [Pedobacter sp. MR22-3]MCX2586178.1 outer membrane beta-barrel family protein [Pedobacter sp. MR22-3]
MKRNVQRAIFIVLIFCSYLAQAQNPGSISGKVINAKDKQPVDFATIAVRNLKDSVVVASGQTAPDGSFTFKAIAPGKYRIYAAFLGLKTATKDVEVAKVAVNAGDIAMTDDGVDLNTVNVTASIPVVVKTDTLEFDAKSIKVRENAVVEDVIKKLPGVEVAKDGSIKAQGETVTKVKVDGKEFFGSDPLLATKNLPADMVDKIQVIDELSEQSQFSGVDDGTRTKILNITTKAGMKKGYFGNSTVGYGTQDRYDASINVNKFDNDQQFSVIGQFNNVNKQNFGQGNGVGNGFGGGGRGNFGGGGSGAGSGGITNTNAGGLNFADTYKDGTQIQGSYFFNRSDVSNQQQSFTQNLLGNRVTTVSNNADNNTDRINHRFNFMIDTKLDSSTTIKIQPNVSYTESDATNLSKYQRNLIESQTIGSQRYISNSSSPNITNNLLVRKKFKRRGRTLSLNVNTSINNNDADNYNYISEDNTINNRDTSTVTDQLNKVNTNSINNTSRLVYTEPLSKTTSLEFNYQNGYSHDNQGRQVLDFNSASGQYDLVNVDYTNTYENQTLTNAGGISFTTNEKKYNWNIGLAAQQTNRVNTNLTTGLVRTQNFINLTPSANFRYNFSNSRRLNIRYRGNTQQPSISQIQPIPDNTNTQSVFIGNPTLKPSFNNSLNINYNNFDIAKGRMFFAFLSLSQTFNAIGNSSQLVTDSTDRDYGKIRTTYVNVDGVYSGNGSVNVGIPLLPERKLTLNASLNANYSRNVNFTTGNDNPNDLVRNITNTIGITNRYNFVTNFDKFDLTGGISGTYNRATYSAQPNANTNFYTLNPSFDISYVFPGNIRLAVDLDYIKNTGRGEGYNTQFTLVNSYISRQFFKNRGTFKIAVNDAFNQNQGISRTATNNTITDLNYNVLKRYYMFSFTYSLTRIGGRNMSGDTPQMPTPGQGGGQRFRM